MFSMQVILGLSGERSVPLIFEWRVCCLIRPIVCQFLHFSCILHVRKWIRWKMLNLFSPLTYFVDTMIMHVVNILVDGFFLLDCHTFCMIAPIVCQLLPHFTES